MAALAKKNRFFSSVILHYVVNSFCFINFIYSWNDKADVDDAMLSTYANFWMLLGTTDIVLSKTALKKIFILVINKMNSSPASCRFDKLRHNLFIFFTPKNTLNLEVLCCIVPTKSGDGLLFCAVFLLFNSNYSLINYISSSVVLFYKV